MNFPIFVKLVRVGEETINEGQRFEKINKSGGIVVIGIFKCPESAFIKSGKSPRFPKGNVGNKAWLRDENKTNEKPQKEDEKEFSV